MSTAIWRHREARERRAVYLQEHPLCEKCGENGLVVAASQIHHLEAQSKRPDLIMLESNWMPVCGPCHEEFTRAEFGSKRKRVGPDGRLY